MSVTSMPRGEVKWVGLDVAKDAIAVGVLDGASEATPRLEKIAHDEVSIRDRGERRTAARARRTDGHAVAHLCVVGRGAERRVGPDIAT